MKISTNFISLTLLLLTLTGSSLAEDLPKLKHDYKLSLKKPYFYLDDKTIPFYSTYGSVVPSSASIRLTPSIPFVKGSIWAKRPNPHKEWMAEVALSVQGQGHLGGYGMGIWYTKEPGIPLSLQHDPNFEDRMGLLLGGAYGGTETWNGLGLFLDTYDENKHQRNMPFVFGIMNDGTKSFKDVAEPADHHDGGCYFNYRSAGIVHFRILYQGSTLTVSIDAKDGQGYSKCFHLDNITLPPNYYFGVSAATGRMPDDHDVNHIDVYEVNPTSSDKKADPLPSDQQAHFDEIQSKIHNLREEQDNEIFHHETTEHVSREDAIPALISAEIVKLQETQMKILDNLGGLYSKVENLPSGSSSSNSAPASNTPSRDAEILTEIQDTKSNLAKVQSKVDLITEIVKDVATYLSHQGTDKSRVDQEHIAQMLEKLDHKISRTSQQVDQASASRSDDSSGGSITSGVILFLLGEAVILMGYTIWKQRQGEKSKKFI